jgi:hypothetical protein
MLYFRFLLLRPYLDKPFAATLACEMQITAMEITFLNFTILDVH